ncbi:helix-turn-helix domain-containing protein, partial [archaeon]|nr:helix-turn-helix domain-containing protein [Bdellovibrionales bacterium]MBT7567288.1 helix-turn-helix domain-containing protein [archaeon]MBT7668457.1 helix-turn-helix domain-containing protein [Bdellovibrionales bacterium]MBT7670437.1 helix-turn-helix domain-containing protein [Bdellovibrionales bacterium]
DTIIKMYESKISQSEIARQLGIARRSVGRALQDM